ncbi:hypothetical protein D3C79_1057800 [compost metagenome]
MIKLERYTIIQYRKESFPVYSDLNLVEEYRRCAQKGEKTFGDENNVFSVDMTTAVIKLKQ